MFFKLAGISAALAGLFVVSLEVSSARGDTSERLPAPVQVVSEPAVPVAKPAPSGEGTAPRPDCRRQAWPYVDPACMTAERRGVRTISVDTREIRNSLFDESETDQ